MLTWAQQPLGQFLEALPHYISLHFQVPVSAALAGEWGNVDPILHSPEFVIFQLQLIGSL